jgi:hypothetical protein
MSSLTIVRHAVTKHGFRTVTEHKLDGNFEAIFQDYDVIDGQIVLVFQASFYELETAIKCFDSLGQSY